MGEALVKILNKAGIEVVFPDNQTCCGAPARYNGAYEVAAQNARDNIKALLETDVTYVVSACPTCTVALKHEFIDTFKSLGITDGHGRPGKLSAKDHRLLHPGQEAGGRRPAHLQGGEELGQDHLPRLLPPEADPEGLRRAPGAPQEGRHEIAEMYECDTCCGMAGSYSSSCRRSPPRSWSAS
jgi:L-lactate dehydrogenase complex protein LldF